ncbi:hypothetical protein DAPPUDRAFT_330373 [Daphnia pulex]|uniref:Uncharacterized protein n=1 Tax=Daphnia pulex TaxID=6669 RepID=E9HJD9_DAPPU|nr:hypothetical protein DAPPUDRAFT_330373 [Daphnia pulex]|eukprot:EFX68152.1 hypothetical protein DAPPUDRAFT_330373 [Daphnia pulex]
MLKDDLSIYERHALPNDLHFAIATSDNMKSFLAADFLTMPNSAGHGKFVMPTIGLVGSGPASYRDLTRTLTDEKGTHYLALSAIVYMGTAIELLKDFKRFSIPSTDSNFLMCGFETQDESITYTPYFISGEALLEVFKTKQVN